MYNDIKQSVTFKKTRGGGGRSKEVSDVSMIYIGIHILMNFEFLMKRIFNETQSNV